MSWGDGARAGAAVVIGVGEYLHVDRVRPLRFAALDAEAVAGALIDPEVCGFPAAEVKLLTDADACRDAVAHHLARWLPDRAKQAELVVIYFAGHGTVHCAGRREEGYLLAHDADPDDLATRGILMIDLARWIEAVEADAVVVCLDCCHAAKVIPRRGPGEDAATRDMRFRPALFRELAGRGRYLIASCDDGQVSIEAEDWGHGLFTHHLLAGLRGAGDRDGDGRVGIAEFFEYVSEAVERDARAIGMVQKPWISATGPGGVILSTRARKPERPLGQNRRPTLRADAERLWRDEGSLSAVRAIDGVMDSASAEELIPAIELLGTMRDPAGVPLLFRCLAHRSESVRARAKQVVRAFGWERVTSAIKDASRRGDEARVGPILDGLAAFEAHEEIVGLLDHLATLLKDDLRNRAILLLERKQQGLESERVASLFRESQSPYQIVKPLGQGLFTAAYMARDESNEFDAVVRVLRPEFACWPQVRAHFLDLARRSMRLVHHNLVLTRDVRDFADRRIYYAVRDYVEGVTLQRLREAGQAFDSGQIVRILRQVVLALTAVHARRMVHGSIKPSNVFLCGEDRVILGDLAIPVGGISLQLDRLSYDYRYASPEMFRQAGRLGSWSDFYSLGCLAYELACGSPPFVSDNHFELAGMHDREAAEPPSRRGSALGPAGDTLILGLLAKTPAGRLADPEAVLRALDELDAALRPKAGALASPQPILGESSLIRYTTEDMVSVVSFAVQLGSPASASAAEDLTTAHDAEGLTGEWAAGGLTTTGRGAGEAADTQLLDETPQTLGHYTLIMQIGSGGLGRVYLARDEKLGRRVAIKVNMVGPHISPDVRGRFMSEAYLLADLKHPNIVSIYDVGTTDEFAYIVLEYVEGGDLRQRMGGDPWPGGAAARFVLTLARTVHYVHLRGIVHRDLKPSNILLTEGGEPKILDFGLGKLFGDQEESATRTLEGTILGTPAYMAPEQASGDIQEIGPATDIHALGVILFELLAGRRPFEGGTMAERLMQVRERRPDPPSRWQPGVPPELDAICLHCLEKSPRDRYPSAGGLADDLERFLEGRPISCSPPSSWDKVRRLLSFGRRGQEKGRPAQ